jgi:hypothetical protein
VQDGSEIIIDNYTRNNVNPGVALLIAGSNFMDGKDVILPSPYYYMKVRYQAAATKWDVIEAPPGANSHTYATTATSYTETATTGEKIVTVTASGQTVTLPTAVENTARLTYKLMVAGTLTLDGNGAQTIDGAATAVLNAQYASITIISDNANWIVV